MKHELKNYSPLCNGVVVEIDGKQEFFETAHIAESFEKYGGSFVQALGIALYRADSINTIKILDTWAALVQEYILTFIYKKNEK